MPDTGCRAPDAGRRYRYLCGQGHAKITYLPGIPDTRRSVRPSVRPFSWLVPKGGSIHRLDWGGRFADGFRLLASAAAAAAAASSATNVDGLRLFRPHHIHGWSARLRGVLERWGWSLPSTIPLLSTCRRGARDTRKWLRPASGSAAASCS